MSITILILQLFGAMLEIAGVFLMAQSLLVTKPRDLPALFFSALYRGAMARGVQWIPTADKKTASIQGLAFIGLGFVIHAISIVLLLALSLKPA